MVVRHHRHCCHYQNCVADWFCKSARDAHELSHDVKSMVCDECDARFSMRSLFDRHAVLHLETSDWQCAIGSCARVFKCKGDLVAHQKEHYSSQYACSECKYKCAQRRYLTYHMKKHNPPGITCDGCGQVFWYYENVKRHQDRGECPESK